MSIDLTATYRAPFRSIVVNFMADGSIEFVAAGEWTDDEIDAVLAAGGADVIGMTSELS